MAQADLKYFPYLSASHKKSSEACQREVEEMLKHPCSFEEAMEQLERNRKASELQGTPQNKNS